MLHGKKDSNTIAHSTNQKNTQFQTICCRCSKYGETRRSGRLVTITIPLKQIKTIFENKYITFRQQQFYQLLSATSNYTKKFLSNTDEFVILFRSETYNPKEEDDSSGTNASAGGGNQSKEEEIKINDIKFWERLSNNDIDGCIKVNDSQQENINFIDIRFVPSFIYNEMIRSTTDKYNSSGSSTNTSAGVSVATKTKQNIKEQASYFGVAIMPTVHPLNPHVGTLWRSSYQQGASFTAIVGRKFGSMNTDTSTCWASIPAFKFPNFSTLVECQPYNCPIVAIAEGGVPLNEFIHPTRALYLLSDVSNGLPTDVLNRAPYRVSIPNIGNGTKMSSIHAASLVLMDRHQKELLKAENQKKMKLKASFTSPNTATTTGIPSRLKRPLSTTENPPPYASSNVLFDGHHLRIIIFLQKNLKKNNDDQYRIIQYFIKTFHLTYEYTNNRDLIIFTLKQALNEQPSKYISRVNSVMENICNDIMSHRVVSSIYYCNNVVVVDHDRDHKDDAKVNVVHNNEPLNKRRRTTTTSSSFSSLSSSSSSSLSTSSVFSPCFNFIGRELASKQEYQNSVFRLQVYPSKEIKKMIYEIPTIVQLDPKNSTHTMYFVQVQDTNKTYLFYGIQPTIYNYNTSNSNQMYISTLKKFKINYSKSCFKLYELYLLNKLIITSNSICLEVGSSSGGDGKGCGGWCEYIESKRQEKMKESGSTMNNETYPCIIDPGQLRSSIKSTFLHIPYHIQDIHIKSPIINQSAYNVFVCDTCSTMGTASKIVKQIVQYMIVKKSIFIMTLRWNKNDDKKNVLLFKNMKQSMERMGCYNIEKVWLFTNQKNERTLIARY